MYSVFLVEDEKLTRDSIRTIIDWDDYGFVFAGEAPDGELALPLIRELKPDILITDIKMPFMDGLELSRMVRAELPDTTVLILSGYDDFSYAQKAITIGVSRYLVKPITKNQLTEVLIHVRQRKDEELVRKRRGEKHEEAARQYWLLESKEKKESSDEDLPEILAPALKHIDGHFADGTLTLAEAAALCGVVPTYFSAVFSRLMGKTFTEYITALRMEKAKELLRGTKLGSGEIAYKVGYDDPHYFSTLFKKTYGCTPREYRGRK